MACKMIVDNLNKLMESACASNKLMLSKTLSRFLLKILPWQRNSAQVLLGTAISHVNIIYFFVNTMYAGACRVYHDYGERLIMFCGQGVGKSGQEHCSLCGIRMEYIKPIYQYAMWDVGRQQEENVNHKCVEGKCSTNIQGTTQKI